MILYFLTWDYLQLTWRRLGCFFHRGHIGLAWTMKNGQMVSTCLHCGKVLSAKGKY
jgi:hypothetical protein